MSLGNRRCPFCSAPFSRVDAARRHAKRCLQRHGLAVPEKKRGRRAKSCARCSQLKVHCHADDDGACARCSSRHLPCSLSRSLPHASNIHSRPPESALPGQPSAHPPDRARILLEFLLDASNEDLDFVTEDALSKEPNGPLVGPTSMSAEQEVDVGTISSVYDDPVLSLPSDFGSWPFSPDWQSFHMEEGQPLCELFTAPSVSRLTSRLASLESELSAHAHRHARVHFDHCAFRQLFTAANVNAFVATFCRKRHCQYPLLHWPTFAVEESSLPLLLAVILTGATYSIGELRGRENAIAARTFYRLADSYIFRTLENILDNPLKDHDPIPAIRSCQAAMFVYALDLLPMNDNTLRWLAVNSRLPTLASALRILRFLDCRHEPREEFEVFVHREEMIRLAAWCFCADALATLSYNKCPSLSITEMSGDLPVAPIVWESGVQAASAPWQCRIGHDRYSLNQLMALLLAHDESRLCQMSLSVFEIHALLCAMQHTIYHLQMSMALSQQAEKLYGSLDIWLKLFDQALLGLNEHERGLLGVSKYAVGLDVVTRKTIEAATRPASTIPPYLLRIPRSSTKELHHFLQNLYL